jgi:hypothetical protein
MRKFYLIIIFISNYGFSQNLYISKSVTENNSIKSYLSEVNSTNGTIINTYLFNQNNNPSLFTTGLKYEEQSNTIYSFKGNRIYKNSASNFTDQTSFGGVPNALYPYREIIVINNRLFATNLTNTSGMNYDLTLYELNKTDGTILNTKNWSVFLTTNGYGTTISESTHEIYNIIGNHLIRYNIVSQETTFFNLPGINLGTSYRGVVLAQNRLFVRKNNGDNNQLSTYILELDIINGAVIATHNLTSNFINYDSYDNLVYLPSTNEIVCSFYKLSATNETRILKFNINSNTANTFNLPSEIKTASIDENYGQLVVFDSNQFLGSIQLEKNKEDSKIKSVYNLLGQKVSIETKNQILFLEYENGQRKKIINY